MNKSTEKLKAISILAEEMYKKRLVIFTGAGCSISAGLPSWKNLIESLLEKYQIKTEDTNFIRLASRLEREIGPIKFREQIVERLRTSPQITTSIYDSMVSLDVNLFITTNYDHLLEDSYRKQGYSPIIIANDMDLPSIDPTRKSIVKLHGDLNSLKSLVITSKDYTKFKTDHKGFVEWLNVVVSQNTILFLGTSFDDPRLKEVDEHVFGIFDKFRRPPFILLKTPTKNIEHEEQFEIDLSDFEALCEDFKERGFFVIPINEYSEIKTVLREIQKNYINNKIKERPSDKETRHILQSEHIGVLERSLDELLDEKTLRLSKQVRGDGRLPTLSLNIERAETLIKHLNDPKIPLTLESQMEGWLTVVDGLLNSKNKNDVLRARDFFNKTALIYKNISNKEKWEERLLRVRAKLLFFEGKTDQAIKSLTHSDDNKTISFWLALLIASNRVDEAYNFVSTHPPHPLWVGKVLCTLVNTGHIQQAEDLFRKTIEEFSNLEKEKLLAGSPFGNKHFYEEICAIMADSLYVRALRLTGKPEKTRVLPFELAEEGKMLCRKALEYIDLLFSKFPRQDIGISYFSTLATLIEMSASALLQLYERADSAATKLISVKPIEREVVNYIINRKGFFSKDFLEKLILRLAEDHPQKSWAFLRIADISAFPLQDKEKSWSNLQKATALAVSLEERLEVSVMAFDIGRMLDRLDDAMAIIEEGLPPEHLWRKHLTALFHNIRQETQKTEKLFADIERQNPPPDITAQIKLVRAENSIKEEKWEDARQLLQDSAELAPDPYTFKKLLFVLTKLQDGAEALRISEKIESFGIEDWQVTYTKAQTARILGQFKKSENTWHRLANKFPQNPEYAYGLAEVLFLKDKFNDALNAVNPFIQCDEKSHFGCLALACAIYEANEEYETAFDLLEGCQKLIENDPSLLFKHMELGYRTDREEEAHRSFMRLEILRQEGKVPEETFLKVPFDKMLEMLKKRRESFEKLKDMYRLGQIPRILLCEHKNMPLYLDWAVRTQKLTLPTETKEWINYTTYSTNSMRVDFDQGRNQLVQIAAPEDVNEIVIDYHALITVHRLGLIEMLEKRYSKIYYPQVLKVLWASDQKRFGHHQLAMEKAYRTLNDKLQTGQIRDFLAPDPPDVNDLKNDTFSKRNLRLAHLEDFPLIDSYLEVESLKTFPEVKVFRLPQVIEWLFSKGKLDRKKFHELKAISEGSPILIKESVKSKLDNASKVLIGETTLELMEQYGLIQLLLDLGVQLIVERATANYIKNAVLELNFGQKVRKWHQALASLVKNKNIFKEVVQEIDSKNRSLIRTPHDEAAFSSIKYAENNKLYLLTDDRWSQMIRSSKLKNNQFGTDVLLTDLYEKQEISLEEYSNHFLQLCKWRYRFLIPDVRIMLFFAKEYKQNLPGEPLRAIADYGRKCLEDTGLFWGLEPTEPPLPLGIKIQMAWTSLWIQFLVNIWEDDDFTEENREKMTQKVYRQYLPHLPMHVKDEIRRNYASVDVAGLVMQLFISATHVKQPIKLHGLLKQTFDTFGYDEKRRLAALQAHFDFIKENIKKEEKDLLRFFVIQGLKAFYGDKMFDPNVISPAFRPILTETGILDTQDPAILREIKTDQGSKDYTLDALPDLITSKRKIPEYIPKGPLIIVPPSEEKSGIILSPHDLIQAPSKEVRIEMLKYILENDNISLSTKQLTEKKSETIKSDASTTWHPAASEVSHALLKDFNYARSLFVQISLSPLDREEKHRQAGEAWANAMTPNLDTVFDKIPSVLKDPFEKEGITKRVEAEIIAKDFTDAGKYQDLLQILQRAFDWYLENVYFVPAGSPLNPWRILNHVFRIPKTRKKTDKDYKKIKGIVTSTDILDAVRKWVDSKEDPLAYLMAFELVLNARAMAEEEEGSAFTGDDFYQYLDRLLELVLNEEKIDTQKEKTKLIHAVWQMRIRLAQYYLKYIDLNIKQSLEDEKRIALAWWMARELESSIIQSLTNLSIRDKILTIENNTKGVIERQKNLIDFTHLFEDQRHCVSPGRYCTLESKHLLASATLSMLFPLNTQIKDENLTFKGLRQPGPALSVELRDEIISKLIFHTIWGDGQITLDVRNEISLLWNFPFCISAPAFLRAYYEDAIDFLGEEKMEVIKLAERVSQSNFLDTELINIAQNIKKKRGLLLAVTFASLKVFVFMHGKMPEGAKVFEKNEMLAREISQLEDTWTPYCLSMLAKTMSRLQAAGVFNWSKIISKQFEKIDYTLCSEQTIELVASELIGVVLLGCDYSLLNPVFKIKASDKRVRMVLGHIKLSLEYAFPRVPGAYRENIRRVLNDLEDIPIPEENQMVGE
jgi:tetratricopeptide (TPR) repeat protein